MSRHRATIRTSYDDPAVIARSVAPDNTAEVDTRIEDGRIVTTITRGTTGSLQMTADDYVVNLAVAADVVRIANQQTEANPNHE